MSRLNAFLVAGLALPSLAMQRKAQEHAARGHLAKLPSAHIARGQTDCPCIGITGVDGTTNVTIGDSLVSYPADVGTRCEAWDDERYPALCEADGEPGKGQGWCAQKWCYVDPCTCEGATPKKASFELDATYQGKPLYYSYDTCGSDDTFPEKSLVGGKARGHKSKGSHKKKKKHADAKKVSGKRQMADDESASKDLTAEAAATENKDAEGEAANPEAAETAEAWTDKAAAQASGDSKPSNDWTAQAGPANKDADSEETAEAWTDKTAAQASGDAKPSNDWNAQGSASKDASKAQWSPSEDERANAPSSSWTKPKSSKPKPASSTEDGSAQKKTKDWVPKEGADWPPSKGKSSSKSTSGQKQQASTSWGNAGKSTKNGMDAASPSWKSVDDGSADKSSKDSTAHQSTSEGKQWDSSSSKSVEGKASSGNSAEEKTAEKSGEPANKKPKNHKAGAEKAADAVEKEPRKAADVAKKVSKRKGEVAKDEEAKAPWEYLKDQIMHKVEEVEKAVEGAVPLEDADKDVNFTSAVKDGKIASGEIAKPNVDVAGRPEEPLPMANPEADVDEEIEDDAKKDEVEEVDDKDGKDAADDAAAPETDEDVKTMCSAGVVDEKTMGKGSCMCVGIANKQQGSAEVLFGDAKVTYPADVGGSCSAWDQETHPECLSDAAASVPDWCQEAWCYVDPCTCDQKGLVRVDKKTGYLPEATSEGKPLFYSYKTCGSVDHWTADNNDLACSNKKSEDDCSGDCLWVGKTCKDQVQMSICGTEDAGALQSGATMPFSLQAFLVAVAVALYTAA